MNHLAIKGTLHDELETPKWMTDKHPYVVSNGEQWWLLINADGYQWDSNTYWKLMVILDVLKLITANSIKMDDNEQMAVIDETLILNGH